MLGLVSTSTPVKKKSLLSSDFPSSPLKKSPHVVSGEKGPKDETGTVSRGKVDHDALLLRNPQLSESSPNKGRAKAASIAPVAPEKSKRTLDLQGKQIAKKTKTISAKIIAASTELSKKLDPSSTTPHVLALPRITDKLTLKELQEEANARGQEKKDLPKLKTDLLDHLVEGSIHLAATDAWEKVQEYRSTIEKEKPNLLEATLQKKQEVARRKAELALKKAEKELEEELRRDDEKLKRRQDEQEKQRNLHQHQFPFVHVHSMACTKDLKIHGEPRTLILRCCRCYSYRKSCVWSCETCNFDICQDCFEKENVSDQEEKRKLEMLAQRAAENEKRRLEAQQKEKELQIISEPSKHFEKHIIKPSAKNKKQSGNEKKGFTVWSSEDHGNDVIYIGGTPSLIEFDSTWMTKEEAHARARYLFLWENPWGLPVHEMKAMDVEESKDKRGLVTYEVHPDDSSIWTVSVCTDKDFPRIRRPKKKKNFYYYDVATP